MSPQQLSKLIQRYKAGIATEEEKAAIEQFFNQPIFNDPALSEEDRRRLEQEMRAALLNRIAEGETQMLPARTRSMRSVLQVAASVTIFLALGIGAWLYLRKTPEPVVVAEKPVELLAYTTEPGQRVKLRLPDSSQIWVNSSTSIRYPRQFTGNTREIYLDKGEAFFEVTHDTSKPFIIHTPAIDTRVLGTSFNVKTNQTDEVAVVTGKVAVANNATGAELAQLLPGKKLVFNRATGNYRESAYNKELLTAWVSGTIIFKDAGYHDIANRLEEWYGVTITFNGPVSTTCLFTAQFDNKSLKEVLNGLQLINAFSYDINGKQVSIKNATCK